LRRRGVALAATTALVVLVAALALRPALRDRDAIGTVPAAPRPVTFPFTRLADSDIAQLERGFAADPASLVAGAHLALALEQKRRLPEAQLIASRLRQIPGVDGDPLLDYVDATLANASDEPQRALVLFTRARDGALARSRGEIIGQVRAARGRLLSTLGEREEAYREMALARADFERAGDDESLARVLNDLAIEHLVRGELAEGQDLLERSIGAAKRSGTSPTLMLSNLGQLASFRGDPATGDRLLREAVADRRREGNPYRLGEVLTLHAEALEDLGRRDEAIASLDEAAAMLREADDQSALLAALQLRGAIAASAGDFDRAGQIAAELQRHGTETGNYLGLCGAFLVRGLAADASGNRDEMRRSLAGAAHLASSKGHHDYAAAIEAAHAAAELRTGDSEAAAELARRALDRLPAGSSTAAPRAVAAAILARVEVANRRLEAARSLLSSFGNDAAESASVSRRIALLTAHAALDRASGRSAEALARLDRAIELARRSGRRFEELELKITRVDATLVLSGDGGRAADADGLRRQASTLGFSGLARPAGSP
jgi:tetratricopeptide (TPR) repeat protein